MFDFGWGNGYRLGMGRTASGNADPLRLAAAAWIRPAEPVAGEPGQRPAHALRRTFVIEGQVADATITATAHGLIEIFVNGSRVGDEELVPGFTAYRARLQVFAWDVAEYLVDGENRIEVLLSDGWFGGRHGSARRADGFGTETALLLSLDGTTADGGVLRLVSDGSWTSAASHITRADLMDGQAVDFRLLDDAGELTAPWSSVSIAQGGASAWRVSDGEFVLDVRIPSGTLATVELPDGSVAEADGGAHAFAAALPTRDQRGIIISHHGMPDTITRSGKRV